MGEAENANNEIIGIDRVLLPSYCTSSVSFLTGLVIQEPFCQSSVSFQQELLHMRCIFWCVSRGRWAQHLPTPLSWSPSYEKCSFELGFPQPVLVEIWLCIIHRALFCNVQIFIQPLFLLISAHKFFFLISFPALCSFIKQDLFYYGTQLWVFSYWESKLFCCFKKKEKEKSTNLFFFFFLQKEIKDGKRDSLTGTLQEFWNRLPLHKIPFFGGSAK